MPNDLFHAIIQIPLATIIAVAFFREAFRVMEHAGSMTRVRMLILVGSISGSFVAWRLAAFFEAVSPAYRASGGQAAQTMLLLGIAVTYLLLREPRRKN